MNEYRQTDPINDSAIIQVSVNGVLSLHTLVGNFSYAAVLDITEDIRRINAEEEYAFPPRSFWQVGVEFDEGDLSVGLPGLGYILDCSRIVELPWQAQNHAEVL